MITLEKDFVDNLEVIGRGESGIVYKYDEEKVLKLFHPKWEKEKVEVAYNISKKVSESGISTAEMYDFVECDDRYGYLSEYLKGLPLPYYIGTAEEQRYAAGIKMGKILKQVHSIPADTSIFPPFKSMFSNLLEMCKDYLTEEEFAEMIEFLDVFNKGNCVLHGDFHENNIIVRDDEFKLIDLDSMCIGNPLFDFVQSYCTYKAPIPEEYKKAGNITDEIIQEFLYLLLENYFDTKDRKQLAIYDEIFTKFAEWDRFVAFIFINGSKKPDETKAFVKENIAGIRVLMKELLKELDKLPW